MTTSANDLDTTTTTTPDRGRAGALWVGSLLGAVLTVALIVALVGGALLAAIPMGLRTLQLRHRVKKVARS